MSQPQNITISMVLKKLFPFPLAVERQLLLGQSHLSKLLVVVIRESEQYHSTQMKADYTKHIYYAQKTLAKREKSLIFELIINKLFMSSKSMNPCTNNTIIVVTRALQEKPFRLK